MEHCRNRAGAAEWNTSTDTEICPAGKKENYDYTITCPDGFHPCDCLDQAPWIGGLEMGGLHLPFSLHAMITDIPCQSGKEEQENRKRNFFIAIIFW